MAVPTLVSVRDFTNSRYAQLAESSDNLNIGDVLASAEAIIQTKLGLSVTVASYTEIVRNTPENIFFVKRRPIVSITSVRKRYPTPYSAWGTMDLDRLTYEPGPGYVEFLYDDVRGFDLEVTYTAGFAEVPANVKEAIMLQAVLLATQDFEVYGTGDSKAPGYVVYMERQITDLLAMYDTTASVYN